jgi:hypothetical protein
VHGRTNNDIADPLDAEAIRSIGAIVDPVERNQRITEAYEQLSRRLCIFIGGPFANWCTYAIWSSRTVGGAIAATDLPLRAKVQLRRLLPDSRIRRAVERRLEAGLPTTRRTVGVRLGLGNRAVFLEVASSLVLFLDELGDDDEADDVKLKELVSAITPLDADDTMSPGRIEDLHDALTWFYRARFASTGDERSEAVLTGSLLLGVYEQTRLQRPIEESFALGVDAMLFPLKRIIGLLPASLRPRAHAVVVVPVRRWLTPPWARLMTSRTMTLRIDGDLIALGAPLRSADGGALYPPTLAHISLPRLRELLRDLELDDGRPVIARDWSSYDDRMRFIGAFFRSRQQEGHLFSVPALQGRW